MIDLSKLKPGPVRVSYGGEELPAPWFYVGKTKFGWLLVESAPNTFFRFSVKGTSPDGKEHRLLGPATKRPRTVRLA